MKKFVYFLMAAAFVGCMAGCVEEQVGNNDSSELKNNDAQVVLRAIDGEANTKAQIDGSTGVFTWDNTDRIAIHSSAGYKLSGKASVDAADAKKADFVISKGEATINGFALYPYTLVFDNDGNVIADCAAAWGEGTGSLVVNLPGTYTLADVADEKSPVPSIATYVDEATPLAFNQIGALLRVTLNNIPPSTKSVTIGFNGVKVQGLFTIDGTVTPGTSQIEAVATTGADDIITINIPDTHGWIDGQDVNVPVPVGTYTNITVTSWDGADGTGNPTLTMTRPIIVSSDTWSAKRHKARKVTTSLPAFSVSDTKRVYIAKSNLQFTRESKSNPWSMTGDHKGTWSFLPESWSKQTEKTIIGDYSYLSFDYANETQITLFAWGCSGYYDAEKTSTYYQPWKTTYENSSSMNSMFGTKTAINLTAEDGYAYGDWGVYACTNQGQLDDHSGYGAFNTWRLPTSNEFLFLLGHTKNDTYDGSYHWGDDENNVKRYYKWGKGLINTDTESVRGFIIVPDYFVDPTGIFIEGYRGDFSNNKNQFTAEQWAIMAEAGAAFLPAAGDILHTYSDQTNERNRMSTNTTSYWTSTSYSKNTHAKAFRLSGNYNNSTLEPASNLSRDSGSAVRLIREL